MSKIVDFMNTLGADAAMERAFHADPEAVMERFGLDADERRAVVAGDADAVRGLAGLEAGGKTNKTIKSYA